jgi:hypothetical protein
MPKYSVSRKAASAACGPNVLIRYVTLLAAGGAMGVSAGSDLRTDTVSCVADSTETISYAPSSPGTPALVELR